MPAPTNISFAAATELTFPCDVTQDVHDAGTNYDVYYKFTAPAGSRVVGIWVFSTIAETYRGRPLIYDSSENLYYTNVNNINKPFYIPVTEGNLYYIFIEKNGDTSPAEIRIRCEVAPNTAIQEGDIFVNDDGIDTAGAPVMPMVVLPPTTNNIIRRYVNNIAEGEGGDILLSGIMALENWLDDTIKIYNVNSDFSLVGSVAAANGPAIRACRGAATPKFYVGFGIGAAAQVKSLLANATFGATIWTPTVAALNVIRGIAASNDETILYYAEGNQNKAVARWDLNTDSALSDLVAGIASTYIFDILVLDDDSIIVIYETDATRDVNVRRYNSAGVLQNTYALGANAFVNFAPARLAYANDDPTSFWVMDHQTTSVQRFRNVRVSDGVIISTMTQGSFRAGAYNGAESATPAVRFGPSVSCPFMIMPGTPTPAEPGLHFFTASGDEHIPNPFVRTALLGD